MHGKGCRNYTKEKIQSFQQGILGKGTAQCKSMKLKHSLTTYTNITSKWFKNLNLRPQTRKLLEENKGKALFDITCSNTFLHMFPKAKELGNKKKVTGGSQLNLKAFAQGRKPSTKQKP